MKLHSAKRVDNPAAPFTDRLCINQATLATAVLASFLSLPVMADPLPAGYSPGFSAAKLSTHNIGVHKDVTLTVTGMGICKNFKINWGDGSENVAEFDFGYSASSKTLIKTHKYSKAGKYFPVVSEIFGPSLAERCGSRTDVPDSSLTIVPEPGKVLGLSATPIKANVGQMIDITVSGEGVCNGARRITAETRESISSTANWNNNLTIKTFAADDKWPRTASFPAAREGIYVVYWYPVDSSSIPTGDCIAYGGPVVVEVTKPHVDLGPMKQQVAPVPRTTIK